MHLAVHGFSLFDWQLAAVDAWEHGDRQAHRGTLEIFTGGGKTLIALVCAERASRLSERLRVAVVVPTEALAHQWIGAVLANTGLTRSDVGLLGAGGNDDLEHHSVLVSVLNTAARRLPDMARAFAGDVMLIVDECHRAGAPTFSRVLSTPARFRLGLSATPDREELDENGEILEFDEQLVGRALGDVVYRFGLREARLAGWLPKFEVHHHGVELLVPERTEYDRISRQIDDLGDRLADLGVEISRARSLVNQPGELGSVANAYVSATSKRKDLLYRAIERERVAGTIVGEVLGRRPQARILLFHERIDEAVRLRNHLIETGVVTVALEHSGLPTRDRSRALDGFRKGSTQVLVSVKSLIEGIDVPSADIGVSVASSSSVRQRIQSLGRVLRRTFDGTEKAAEMHVLYVTDTADELIYAKEDWSDLTGAAANRYWTWRADRPAPEPRDGPPHEPRPTEDQEWARLGYAPPAEPTPWLGALPDREYSVDTRGTVRTRSGAVVENPQDVALIMERVRGRPGGRFYVTPGHRLIVIGEGGRQGRLMVAGRLGEPFSIRDLGQPGAADLDVTHLAAGDPYPGTADAARGEYRLLQKRGGVIQRSVAAGAKEFALTANADAAKVQNAQRLLKAWRRVSSTGLKVAVNDAWHAWYLDGGEPRFLAEVPGGFAWPTEIREGADDDPLPGQRPVQCE